MSAEISYRETTKLVPELPGNLEDLYQKVKELFGNTLPAQWFIGSINASNSEKKFLDKDEYRAILRASPGGEKIEFYIEKVSEEEFDESIKDMNFTIPVYESQFIFVGENKNQEKEQENIEKILDDLSSDEEQKEEAKNDEPTDNGEKRGPNNLHQRESQELSEIEVLEQKLTLSMEKIYSD